MTLDCVVPGCEYKTPEDVKNVDKKLELMSLHCKYSHKANENNEATNKNNGREKVKRPQLKLDGDESDWQYWEERWNDYKSVVSLKENEILVELKECFDEDLRREMFRQYPSGFKTEKEMLEGLKKLVIRKRNITVLRDELHNLYQD